ncbi:MAG: SDR family oxidoreductase [Solirubrobacterales bacterium]|nr:SDR family oxidoreductase [Solirubrobacterales bacterium]MBV9915713.1 SDR family oxidoreductase [Solirubrobacterales bacterium]
MIVAIAGAHGKIGLALGQLLAQDGSQVRGLIRNANHAPDLEAIGVRPVISDLEQDDPRLADHLRGATAAVFAAGAGPGSGAARKVTMDRDGAVRLIDACRQAGVRRYVMISAMGARPGVDFGGGVFGAYLEAKTQADEALEASGLDYTIVRPGGLTDDPPTEKVALAAQLERGSIPRADVARTLVAVLHAPNTIGKAFDLISGRTPIREAVTAV